MRYYYIMIVDYISYLDMILLDIGGYDNVRLQRRINSCRQGNIYDYSYIMVGEGYQPEYSVRSRHQIAMQIDRSQAGNN